MYTYIRQYNIILLTIYYPPGRLQLAWLNFLPTTTSNGLWPVLLVDPSTYMIVIQGWKSMYCVDTQNLSSLWLFTEPSRSCCQRRSWMPRFCCGNMQVRNDI